MCVYLRVCVCVCNTFKRNNPHRIKLSYGKQRYKLIFLDHKLTSFGKLETREKCYYTKNKVCWSSLSSPHSWFITGFVTRVTRQVPLVEQELTEHLSSPPVFSGFRGTRPLALCVMFVDWCLSLFLPLCCLSFDLRILITPLVYSNSFYQ